MKGSLKIAKLFGVPVFLHWSFAIVPIAVFYLWKEEGTGPDGLLWMSLFAGCLFLSILLHEYGHALAARRFGVETKDIILLPIGGLARLSRLPKRPLHELIVAIAGPLVNVGIALLLAPYFYFVFWENIEINALPYPEVITEDFTFFIPLLLGLNLMLALFNLIPAFPMDGGRILRALLSMRFSRLKATWVAATLGQLIAGGMVVFALMKSRPSYTFIGAFIYITARREYRWVKTESILEAHTVGEALQSKEEGEIPHSVYLSIPISATLKEANEKMQMEKTDTLLVTEAGVRVGVLENRMIWECLEKAEEVEKGK